MFAGTATQSISDNDALIHANQNLFNGASSAFYLDGTNTVVGATPGTNGVEVGRASAIGCNNNSTNPATVNWFETGVWIADKTANNAAMNSNQHNYWNF